MYRTWLERVRPDAAVDEAAAVLEDARLRLVEARRRVRPQTLAVRRRAREDLRWEKNSITINIEYLITQTDRIGIAYRLFDF